MKKIIVILLTLALTLGLGVVASADADELPVSSSSETIDVAPEAGDPTQATLTDTGAEANDAPPDPFVDADEDANDALTETDATEGGTLTETGDTRAETTVSDASPETDEEASNASAEGDPLENGESAEQNPFAALYELAIAHTSEIFSAVAAILSCVIAFAYRRGLLPLLKGGLGTLSGAVKSIDKATEEAREQMRTEAADSHQLTERIESRVDQLSQSVGEALARFDALESEKEERALLLSTLECEVELLGEIFLASSLPEYRKEIVGNTVARLKEKLAGGRGA